MGGGPGAAPARAADEDIIMCARTRTSGLGARKGDDGTREIRTGVRGECGTNSLQSHADFSKSFFTLAISIYDVV